MSTDPFTFAVYAIQVGEKKNPQLLSAIQRKADLLELLASFLSESSSLMHDDEKKRSILEPGDFHVDDRLIFGSISTGTYGQSGRIVDRRTGKLEFPKHRDHANMSPHLYCFFVPHKSYTGVLISQTVANLGIATFFQKHFQHEFTKQFNVPLHFLRHAPGDYIDRLVAGDAKSITFRKKEAPRGYDSQLFGFGIGKDVGTVELKIFPKKNFHFNLSDNLRRRITKKEGLGGLEAIVPAGFEEYDSVLVELEFNGKRRTLKVDSLGVGRPEYEAQLEVDPETGYPLVDAFKEFARGVTDDVIASYRGSDEDEG